ncbi:MAG: vitamin B12 ABC transporter permease BtuC, partial [Serratia liquefaciens]|nr:vitamin B12 ABC transporter permease BtuC [Serratia liquefaciens]
MSTSQTFTLLLHKQRHRDKRHLLLLTLGVAVAFVFSLSAGDVWLWPSQWSSEAAQLFVWQLRLPRAL